MKQLNFLFVGFESSDIHSFAMSRVTCHRFHKILISPAIQSDLNVSWRKFFESTKLAGLNRISGSSKKYRFLLLLVWLMCFTITMYKCWQWVTMYLHYDIKTIISYRTANSLPFPAVTLCNVNGIRRSTLGLSDVSITMYVQLFVGNDEDMLLLTKENRKVCHVDEQNYNATEAKRISDLLVHTLAVQDLETFYKTLALDSTFSLHACWWNNREYNCSDIFVNHQIDNNACFTFNQDPANVDVGNGTFASKVYGMTSNEYAEKRSLIGGPSNGLRLLINVHQEEYCTVLKTRSGAGFHALIHDLNSQPSFTLDPFIGFSPGYDYSVALRPVTYDLRNFSEWLGRCESKFLSFLKPNATEYNRYACFMQCMLEIIWRDCHCLLMNHDNIYSESIASNLGTDVKYLRTCDVIKGDMKCMSARITNYIENNPDVICPKCKKSCLETKYESQVSMKKLSKQQLQILPMGKQYMNETAKKNYIQLSFSFCDMGYVTIQETQLYTPLHLFIGIGGTLGLFLGSSMVAFYEVIHQALITFSILIKNFRRKRKFKKTIQPVLFSIQANHETEMTVKQKVKFKKV